MFSVAAATELDLSRKRFVATDCNSESGFQTNAALLVHGNVDLVRSFAVSLFLHPAASNQSFVDAAFRDRKRATSCSHCWATPSNDGTPGMTFRFGFFSHVK